MIKANKPNTIAIEYLMTYIFISIPPPEGLQIITDTFKSIIAKIIHHYQLFRKFGACIFNNQYI